MSFQQLPHHMPEGAGQIFVIQKTDINGIALNPAPRFQLSLMKIGFENVREIKTQNGKYAVPTDMVTGKETPKLKAELFNYDIEQINSMFYGGDIVSGATVTHTDKITIPDGSVMSAKINNVKSFFLGRWFSTTTVKLAGATVSPLNTITVSAGNVGDKEGKYYFNKADVGKTVELTWVCVGGATVVSTFKVPPVINGESKLFLGNFNKCTSVKKGAATWTANTYNPAGAAPSSGNYQCSSSGVFICNSADTGSITIAHTTDNVSVSSVIATLPTAAYRVIIDPPLVAKYLSTDYVKLTANAGTAMTGTAVGEFLTLIDTGTPASGECLPSDDGILLFAAADVGDTVSIKYNQDYYYVYITPPDSGDFVKHLSVQIKQVGQPLKEMREVYGTGGSIAYNEYVVDGNGTLYFDASNSGQEVFYSYLYKTETLGRTLDYDNHEQGSGIELELIVTHKGGQYLDTISNMRAMAKHHKLDETEGDKAKSDVEFELYANEDGKIYTWSTTLEGA